MTSSVRSSRSLRIVGSVVLILISLSGVMIAASGIRLTYYLPPAPGSGGTATRHTTTFGPAIAATITTGVLALVVVAWLVWNVIRVPARWMWIGVTLLAVIAVVVGISASQLPRPTF